MAIVLVSSDLTVLSRVEGAASRLGKLVRITAEPSQVFEDSGADSAELLIVDLSLPALDLAALMEQVKSHAASATRVIAFGPHVHEDRLAAARNVGCDLVISRGQFFAQLDAILAP